MERMTKMPCPRCGGRAFDISKVPWEPIKVTLKCPRCQNIVAITCSQRRPNIVRSSKLKTI